MHINSLSRSLITSFQEVVLPTFTHQQKKAALIATAIIVAVGSILAICRYCCFSAKKGNSEESFEEVKKEIYSPGHVRPNNPWFSWTSSSSSSSFSSSPVSSKLLSSSSSYV